MCCIFYTEYPVYRFLSIHTLFTNSSADLRLVITAWNVHLQWNSGCPELPLWYSRAARGSRQVHYWWKRRQSAWLWSEATATVPRENEEWSEKVRRLLCPETVIFFIFINPVDKLHYTWHNVALYVGKFFWWCKILHYSANDFINSEEWMIVLFFGLLNWPTK